MFCLKNMEQKNNMADKHVSERFFFHNYICQM